jgi:nitrite reductase (NO-forming)
MLFNAEIGANSYLEPGQKGTVIFTPNNAGSFYYICPVPGHAELGMFGSIVITG